MRDSGPETQRQCAPFGTWKSPITVDMLATGNTDIDQIVPNHGSSTRLYFVEARPGENGRYCIVEQTFSSKGKPEGLRDVLPKPYSARTQVHEYGGGAAVMCPGGSLIFSDWETKGVFRLNPETKEVMCIIEGNRNVYYADFSTHEVLPNELVAIREDHRSEEIVNSIVAINTSEKTVHVVVEGADFYSHPRIDAQREDPAHRARISWLQWNHPHMPWTGGALYVASWTSGPPGAPGAKVGKPQVVAGNPGKEGICQPTWGLNDGNLYFCSDRTGFWQLYCLEDGATEAKQIKLKGLEEGDLAGPEWRLGTTFFTPLSQEKIVALWTKDAAQRLVTIDLRSSTYSFPPYPAMNKRFPSIRARSKSSFAIIAGTADAPSALYSIDLVNALNTTILKGTTDISSISDSYFSTLETISFPRKHGSIRSGVSYAVLMRPTNPDFYGPDHTLPPCIVLMHGGPTSNIPPEFNLSFQYYTSRGFVLAVVNYLGSSGFGREYRKGLDGEIGIMDIADGVSCVDYLASMKYIDRTRVGIVGASAGGYATLQSLCTYPDVFAGGVSRYGIGDWKRCIKETHKFESRYLDKLIYGDKDLSEKEKDELLRQRSPLFNAEKIKSPLLLLQGSIDKVVPPNQAEEMEKIVTENGGEAKLIIFEGEGHGFGQAKHIKAAVEEEEKWWLKTLVREGQR